MKEQVLALLATGLIIDAVATRFNVKVVDVCKIASDAQTVEKPPSIPFKNKQELLELFNKYIPGLDISGLKACNIDTLKEALIMIHKREKIVKSQGKTKQQIAHNLKLPGLENATKSCLLQIEEYLIHD